MFSLITLKTNFGQTITNNTFLGENILKQNIYQVDKTFTSTVKLFFKQHFYLQLIKKISSVLLRTTIVIKTLQLFQ